MNVPELVVPAGSPEKLEIALDYGADAVYLSDEHFGLRRFATNFDSGSIKNAIKIVKEKGKKVYLAVNIVCRNDDIIKLKSFLRDVNKLNIDALIISDPGAVKVAREFCPDIPIHLSTQANTLNFESVNFWGNYGIKRVILARELSCGEVAGIVSNTNIEVEVFAHGALCISYAGKCYMSAYMDGRESNMGMCSQPCRREYEVVDKESGLALPVEIGEDGVYIFNTKDLCLVEHLPQIAQIGISAVKIEGRMKTTYYLACVTRVYRQALDYLKKNNNIPADMMGEFKIELAKVSNRGYTTGFFGGSSVNDFIQKDGKYIQTYQFLGIIGETDSLAFSLNPKGKICVGDKIEVFGAKWGSDRVVEVTAIKRGGIDCREVHPNQLSEVFVNGYVCRGEFLRKQII